MPVNIHNGLCLRDPKETTLGQSILKYSIILIDELGFEHFTFKKLATKINSTEASIYRYFENKHLLLVYLSNWYWEYMYVNIQNRMCE
jgi:AcrR family transcriptional regulator